MAKIQIHPAQSKGVISRNIYGHFSEHLGRCIYQGLFVGKNSPIPNVNGMRTDVVEVLKKIQIPVLRWPGGCFADEYHWRDGIGPQENRRRMVNTNWGDVVEDNSFGTHEFLELCAQLGCEPYINANVGSGTVREMAEWVEYLNSDGDSTIVRERRANGRHDSWGVKYWGVGNENWGCGSNMRPEYYADEYRRYQTYCRKYGPNRLFKIACGPNTDDYNWMDVLMKNAAPYMDAITMHYYTLPTNDWAHKGSATEYTDEEYYKTLVHALRMEELVSNHLAVMDKYDPEHRVGLIVDEWGVWYDVEPDTNPGFLYQLNTMRDAMAAALTLDVFNNHCDRVIMANLAQTVNVLQSVVLTEGDRMVLTPTYHVFELYNAHHDARQLACDIECDTIGLDQWQLPQLSATASEKDGRITLTVTNTSGSEAATVTLELDGKALESMEGRILTGNTHDGNNFESSSVAPKPFDGVQILENGQAVITLPACSVTALTFQA